MTAVGLLAVLRAVEGNDVTPGVLGFVVVALLGVATYLLIRSMNRRIGRIDLPDDDPGPGGPQRTDQQDQPEPPEPPAGATPSR